MKGTLFPGLDLPYRGTSGVEPRDADGMQSMQDLQAANFAITELGLYLDTHADDEEAVQLFNQYVEQYEMLRQQAADNGMALTQMQAAVTPGWTIHGPGTRKRRNKRCLYMKKSCNILSASQTRIPSWQL